MFKGFSRIWLATLTAVVALNAQAVEIRFQTVAPGIFAFVGETGARTPENEGLNANIGLVVTSAGALLIDSGATWRGAKQIEAAARQVTEQRIRWVINTGGQDHRWLGNGYFTAQGAQVMAHKDAKADMVARGGDHMQSLRRELNGLLDGTEPTLPTRWLSADDETLTLGDTVVEIKHRGGAHTPGDVVVWLPKQQVAFSGDAVYVDRMLGIFPFSNTRHWLDTFAALEALRPQLIVPGHGAVCNLARAQADTRDYLLALRAHMKQAVEAGTDISTAIRSFDAAPFMRLRNAAELHPGNASRTYLEMELE